MSNPRVTREKMRVYRSTILSEKRGVRGEDPQWFLPENKTARAVCESLAKDGFMEYDPPSNRYRVTRNGVLEALRLEVNPCPMMAK